MKACVIQVPYSNDQARSDECFAYKLKCLAECDESADILVLPEYSDVPCATTTGEETLFYHKKYIERLLSSCRETARRCQAMVFVNALCEVEGEYRNTTYAFDRQGELAGQYFKRHIPPAERALNIAFGYTERFSEPYVLEMDGIRFGFLTCYDFYFYEAFAAIARKNVDVIIGCSLQRSDTHDAIEIICRNLAYNTNAYVLRSSVSFDEEATVCGASMIVSPQGKVLANMKGRFGIATASFDPHKKYAKPAGFGRAPAAHYQYIEEGRRPFQYRPSGSAICLNDEEMPYPRVCAHRGFSTIAPENSLPAFGAAVSLGADEIEFDLWTTKDKKWVSIHDYNLERVSDGHGNVFDYTLEELRALDFGKKFSPEFEGLRILTLEDILEKLSCHVIMNIHVKTLEEAGMGQAIYEDETILRLIHAIRAYDCEKYVYFMTVSEALHQKLSVFAPDIARCMGENMSRDPDIVERAIRTGCKKVQLYKPFYFDQEMIDRAHAHGIRCNMFWSDDPEEAEKFLSMGVDTILSNRYYQVARRVKK